MDIKNLIVDKVKTQFGDALKEVVEFAGDLNLVIDSKKITELAEFLKNDPELQFLMCKDVTAIDWGTRKNRFTVVYHVYSFSLNFTLRIKCNLEGEETQIDSVSEIWLSANWYERETYDMYGIIFNDHPDLRRMYLPEGFEYYPLRKDFPVLGIPNSLPLPNKID
jgi:NADH-quinone oxidoreductase subunit C